MRSVLASVLLLCSVARADDAAPALSSAPAQVVEVEEGQVLTADGLALKVGHGLFLDELAAVKLAQQVQSDQLTLKQLQADNAKLTTSASTPVTLLVTVAVLALAGGIVIGLRAK